MDGQDGNGKRASKPPPPPKAPTAVVALGSIANGHPLHCDRTKVAGHILLVIGQWNKSYTAMDAMKALDFPEEECKNKSMQKRVRRQKIKQMKDSPPLFIETVVNGTGVNGTSLMSPLTNPGDGEPPGAAVAMGSVIVDSSNSNQKRKPTADATASAATASPGTLAITADVATAGAATAAAPLKKKPRRNHSQLIYDQAIMNDSNGRHQQSYELQEKSTRLNKDDMVGALMEAEEHPPVGEVKWNAVDEAEMKRLIEEDIKIKDTELGKAMAKDIKEMLSMTKSITPQRMEIAEAHLTQEELEHLTAVRMHWPCQEG
eukprot:jgi/Psemu1/12415/gm1.12415_g